MFNLIVEVENSENSILFVQKKIPLKIDSAFSSISLQVQHTKKLHPTERKGKV